MSSWSFGLFAMRFMVSKWSIDAIFTLYRQSLAKVRSLLLQMLDDALPMEEVEIRTALSHAMMCDENSLNEEQKSWLTVLKA